MDPGKHQNKDKNKMYSQNTYTANPNSSRSWRRNQNTVRFSAKPGLGPVSHTIFIAVLLAVLGLIYLTQITKTSTYGYQINDLSQKKEQLLSEKSDLEVENARLQALERVKSSDVASAMVSPESTDYARAN